MDLFTSPWNRSSHTHLPITPGRQTHFGAIQGLNFAFSLNFAEADLECALPKLVKFGSEIHVNVKALSDDLLSEGSQALSSLTEQVVLRL